LSHEDEPSLFEYAPLGHIKHLEEPSGEYVPLGH